MRPRRAHLEGSLLRWLLCLCLVPLCAAGCGAGEDATTATQAPGSSRAPRPNEEQPEAEHGSTPAVERAKAPAAVIEPRFLARRELPVPGKPLGVLIQDLDGDGHPELVCALSAPPLVLIWRGGPTGIATAPIEVHAAGWPLPPVVVDGVGGRRLALASRTEEELLLLDLRDLDSVPSAVRVPLGARPRALGAGDLELDGEGELVIATDSGELLVLTAGRVSMRAALTATRPTCAHVLRGGEGVAVGFQIEGKVEVYTTADLLSGSAPTRTLELGGIPRAMTEIDYDGDGDLELLVAGGDKQLWVAGVDAPGGAEAWLSNDAPPHQDMTAPGLVPLALAVADLDRSGTEELVTLNYMDSSYGLLANFQVPGQQLKTSEAAGQTPVDCALGDLDGDGLPDLAVANRDALRVSLLSGTGIARPQKQAFYQALRIPVGNGPRAVLATDLTGDGFPEPVVVNAADETASALASSWGRLQPGPAPVYLGREPDAPVLADLDGAPPLDLALLCQYDAETRLVSRLGTPRGFLGARPEAPEVAVATGAVDLIALDLDLDRRDDLVVADREGGALILLRNQAGPAGHVRFDPPTVLPLEPAPVAVCVLREASAARGAVLAVALSGPGEPAVVQLVMLSSDGSVPIQDDAWRGARITPRRTTGDAGGGGAIDLEAGDVNGDGARDLVLLTGGGRGSLEGWVHLLRARGESLEPLLAKATGNQPVALALGDVNHDGRTDVFCAAQNSHNLGWWLAREGASADEVTLERQHDLGAGYGPLDVHLEDLDNDGDLDALTANAFSNDVSALYNTP